MSLKELDKKEKQVSELQAELDRRTVEEQKAADLMTEGRNKEGDAVLADLDDDVIIKLAE